jgi:hypothetical protein
MAIKTGNANFAACVTEKVHLHCVTSQFGSYFTNLRRWLAAE